MALTARHAATTAPEGLSLPALPVPGRRGAALGLGAAFALATAGALLVPTGGLDLWAMKEIQAVSFPGLAMVLDRVNELTGSTGAIGAWALLLVAFAVAGRYLPALAMATLPVAGAVNEGIGTFLVPRTRPHLAELERTSANFEERSFPSGHVVGAVMLYGFLFYLAGRIEHRGLRLAVRGGSAAALASVGFARVWSGAHWPTDVVGAYALGGLLLLALTAAYGRVEEAVRGLPFVHAGALPHDEAVPHAHALTSLVLFEEATVTKVYNPGFLPRAIYWLAFQAPFPYVGNRAALEAALHRRNLAGRLTEYWYGTNRVARALSVETINGREGLVSERVAGHEPKNREVAAAFLRGLRVRFEEAGLPTWQIDPRQPRAIDNVLETADGTYQIVDLESGLVSPMASLTTWKRALRRGLVPFYDEVFFDVTRAYVVKHEAAMRAALGEAGFADLTAELDAAEAATKVWHAGEPRLWGKVYRAVTTGFGVRTWPARTRAMVAQGHGKGQEWMDRAVQTWTDEGRITEAEAAGLREQIAAPTFQAMLPYLSAHIAVSIPLRFPLGSIARTVMVLGALAVAFGRMVARKSTREEFGLAWSIHSPLVAIVAAIPGFGTFAYLFAKPVRANRLLLRTLGDMALRKTPKGLYPRTGLQRLVARPTAAEVAAREEAPETGTEGALWELAWAAEPRPVRGAPRTVPVSTPASAPVSFPVAVTRIAPRLPRPAPTPAFAPAALAVMPSGVAALDHLAREPAPRAA